MIEQKHIDALGSRLRVILNDELELGNVVCETHIGGFSESYEGHIFVFLKYPFICSVRYDAEGVTYREINDPHYWKAEYDDEENHQTLACRF